MRRLLVILSVIAAVILGHTPLAHAGSWLGGCMARGPYAPLVAEASYDLTRYGYFVTASGTDVDRVVRGVRVGGITTTVQVRSQDGAWLGQFVVGNQPVTRWVPRRDARAPRAIAQFRSTGIQDGWSHHYCSFAAAP